MEKTMTKTEILCCLTFEWDFGFRDDLALTVARKMSWISMVDQVGYGLWKSDNKTQE